MILLLSADHRTHGLDVVAAVGGTAAHLGPDLLATVPGVDGVVVIGTCNRLALLLDVPAAHPRPGASPASLDVAAATARFLAARAGLDALDLRRWEGPEAVAELFATASGLESMVVGEREIAGQVRRAMILAHQEGTLTGPLARLIEHASSASRRVARTTGLTGTGRSVVSVGLDMAGEQLGVQDWSWVRVLVVGTGAYAGATVTALRERGVRDIEVYSRSARAQAFADGHRLRAVSDEELPAALGLADLVVTCRGLGSPVLTRELVAPVAHGRAGAPGAGGEAERPVVVVDLALTRDVEESVADLPGVLLIDLPQVQRAVPAAEAAQVRSAREIVDEEARAYCRLAGGRRMDPVISALRSYVDELVEREVSRLHARDGMVDADEAARALRRLAARLLHHPSVAARQAGEAGRDEEYVAALPLLLGEHVTGALRAGVEAPLECPVSSGEVHGV